MITAQIPSSRRSYFRNLVGSTFVSILLQHQFLNRMSSNPNSENNMDCIVLDGMHDDSATKCWVRILRHGVAFRIEATADGVQDTPLYQQWQAIIAEIEGRLRENPADRIDRWDQLCNLLIETSLPVLQNLAPEAQAPAQGTRHPSLQKCFHGTTYCLQLVKDSMSQDVQASVTSGPVDGSLHGFRTDREGTFDILGTDLTRYSSQDITIVEKGISTPPRKVQTPDGAVHYFEPYMQDSGKSQHVDSGKRSRDVISAHLQLHRNPGVIGIPPVSGIVVHEGAFAGILLQGIRTAGTLMNRLSTITTIEALETTRQLIPGWQTRITSVVAQLHDRGYILNDGVSECDVDETGLLVDEEDNIWLRLVWISESGGEGGDRLACKDKEAVERVFGHFAPEELARVESQI